MTICDKCRKQSGTIRIYGFCRWGGNAENTYDLCEPCAKEIDQKIKELVNNENI